MSERSERVVKAVTSVLVREGVSEVEAISEGTGVIVLEPSVSEVGA